MVLSSEMEQDRKPKWLLELENRKRTTRLAHEIGAGSPCIKCASNCPGLDLHFWRKTCKNCKCSRDDHDVPNDEFPQFDLLFGKSQVQSNKKKMIVLKVDEIENHNGQTFDWIPPDTSIELAADYMKALPNDKLPIKGSAGAALRKQQLQKQLPLHDIDHKACDGLSESECTQFTRYLNNIKKYAGQGKVTKFITAKPFDKDQIKNTNSECLRRQNEEPTNHHNINLRTPGSFVPKTFSSLSHGIQSHDQDGNIFTRYPSPAELRIENKSFEEKTNIVPDREYPTANQNSEQYLQHPHSFDSIKNNYDIANSTRVPGYQDNSYNLRQVRPSYPGESQVPINADRQVLNFKNPGDDLAQSEDVNKTPNSSLRFPQTNTYNDNSKKDLVSSESLPYAHQFQMTGGNYPKKTVLHSESLNRPLNSIGPLDKYHQNSLSNQQHIIANSKNNYDLVHSSIVPSTSFQDNEQNLQHSQLPERLDNQILRSRPVDYLIHSKSTNNPLNSALNLPQTNLLSDNSNDDSISSTNIPYSHQLQRTGGFNPGKSFINQVSPHYPQMSNRLEKSINNHDSSLQNYNNDEENAILADKILADALLPPSSVNSGDIIGSTLDQKVLNEIREKLTSKYLDEPTELNGSLPVKNLGFSDKNLIDSNSKSADAHLSSYGGIRPHLIHSQEQNISIFPTECIGSSQTMNNSAADYLCDTMNNLSVIQKKAQNCHQCQQDIHVGDVVVTAEKAENAVWHPGCFVCSTCNELLADLVYFYYKEKLYCGRDLAGLLEIPRCFACDELIFVREYTVAEGHNYHVKHFCCWDCDLPLAGQQYISDDDRPLCLACYEKLYAKTCATCNGVIAPDQVGVAVKHLDFHATDNCFCCAGCNERLNNRIAIKNDKPFCSKECITKFSSEY